MDPSIAPAVKQSLIMNVYALFAHNYIAFAYLFGLLISIGLSIYRPSRFAIFTLLGFAVLLFSFEYDKHIIAGLRDQTIRSLSLPQEHYKIQRLVELTITNIIPILLYLLGWSLLYLAIVYAAIKINKPEKHHGTKKTSGKH